MFLRVCVTVLALAAAALPGARASAEAPGAARLLDLLRLPEVVAVMREEGRAYGAELAEEMLADGPSAGWDATVAHIYDADRMAETVRERFLEKMAGVDPAPLVAFFETEAAQRLVANEVAARRAMIDDAVEAAAREAYLVRAQDPDATFRLVRAFVRVNDLVESNVAGALNSNFAFYRGLADGGALEMGESEMLAEVWAQEEATRADTRDWLYGFLLTAYDPLPEAVLERYVELSGTEAGRAMNSALFAGFDRMYAEISYALGLALAREMQATEL
jgi:hypothetical protein